MKMPRIYECDECGEQKEIMSKPRGISCPNCGCIMQFKEVRIREPKKIK